MIIILYNVIGTRTIKKGFFCVMYEKIWVLVWRNLVKRDLEEVALVGMSRAAVNLMSVAQVV